MLQNIGALLVVVSASLSKRFRQKRSHAKCDITTCSEKDETSGVTVPQLIASRAERRSQHPMLTRIRKLAPFRPSCCHTSSLSTEVATMKGSARGLPCLDRHLSGVERAMPFSGTWSIAALLFEMRAGTHMAYGLISSGSFRAPSTRLPRNFSP